MNCFSKSRLTSLASALVLATFSTSAAGLIQTAETSPLFGRWKFNPAKSDMTAWSIAFSGDPGGELTMTAMGETYRFRMDGREYPAIWGQTAAWKQIDSKTWETTNKLKGELTGVDIVTLSEDAQQLTVNSKWVAPRAFEETLFHERKAGTTGLAGVWRPTDIKGDRMTEITSSGRQGVIIRWMNWEEKAELDLRGTEAPVTGPVALPGLTVALTQKGPTTFEYVEKKDGKLFATSTWTHSEDGKTSTSHVTLADPAAKQQRLVLVYDRQ